MHLLALLAELAVAVAVIVGVVSRVRINSRSRRHDQPGGIPASGQPPEQRLEPPASVPDQPPPGPSPSASGGEASQRYREDRASRPWRSAGIALLLFLAASGLTALLVVTGEGGSTWAPITVMVFSGLFALLSVCASQPGIRVRDDGFSLGHVAYAERHPARPGLTQKLGVPHFVLSVPISDVVEVRFLHGEERIRAIRDRIRRSAPPRVGANGKPLRARKRVLGLFYAGKLPDALYLRLRPDRVPDVPFLLIADGVGNTSTWQTVWSGPELLIGTKHPAALEEAVRAVVARHEEAGGQRLAIGSDPPMSPPMSRPGR